MACAFGVIHGLGFANALAELGLSGNGVFAPLAGFNVGVDLGQFAVVALVLPMLGFPRLRPTYPARVLPATSLGIAALAVGWLVQRLGGLVRTHFRGARPVVVQGTRLTFW